MIYVFLEISTSFFFIFTRNQLHKINPTSTFYSLNNSDQDAMSRERLRQSFMDGIWWYMIFSRFPQVFSSFSPEISFIKLIRLARFTLWTILIKMQCRENDFDNLSWMVFDDIWFSRDFHKFFLHFHRNQLHKINPTSTFYSLNNSDQDAMSRERLRQSFMDGIWWYMFFSRFPQVFSSFSPEISFIKLIRLARFTLWTILIKMQCRENDFDNLSWMVFDDIWFSRDFHKFFLHFHQKSAS